MTAVVDTGVDASEAWAFVEQLEERVREGDRTVLPSDIAAARSHAEDLEHFERLQQEHVERENAREAERRRQQDAAEIREELEDLTDAQQLLDTFDGAVAALRALNELADGRAARIAALTGRVRTLQGAEEFGLVLGGLESTDAMAVGVRESPLRARYIPKEQLVEAALRTALGRTEEPHGGLNEVADLRGRNPKEDQT